jgi:hypothetical protein
MDLLWRLTYVDPIFGLLVSILTFAWGLLVFAGITWLKNKLARKEVSK